MADSLELEQLAWEKARCLHNVPDKMCFPNPRPLLVREDYRHSMSLGHQFMDQGVDESRFILG